MKQLLLRIYNWGFVSAAVCDLRQEEIRNIDRLSVKNGIKPGNFLDLGCGTGYAMISAKTEARCSAWGVDPEPRKHGESGLHAVFLQTLYSHSGKSFLFDMCYYIVKNLKKIVEAQFVTMETLLSWVYPYSEYRKIFPPLHSKRISSSVFFVCNRK